MARVCAAAFVLVLVGGAWAEEPAKAQGKPIPVDQLLEECEANEVRAEKVYGTQEVIVVGRVVRVMKNRGDGKGEVKDDEYFVVWLGSASADPRRPESFSAGGRLPARLKCLFARSEEGALAKLLRRHEVVVRGTCRPITVRVGPEGQQSERTEVELCGCKVINIKELDRP